MCVRLLIFYDHIISYVTIEMMMAKGKSTLSKSLHTVDERRKNKNVMFVPLHARVFMYTHIHTRISTGFAIAAAAAAKRGGRRREEEG